MKQFCIPSDGAETHPLTERPQDLQLTRFIYPLILITRQLSQISTLLYFYWAFTWWNIHKAVIGICHRQKTEMDSRPEGRQSPWNLGMCTNQWQYRTPSGWVTVFDQARNSVYRRQSKCVYLNLFLSLFFFFLPHNSLLNDVRKLKTSFLITDEISFIDELCTRCVW